MPISCEHYDCIEIACLFHYVVTIYLNNGNTMVGKALTTSISRAGAEELVVAIRGEKTMIPIEQINKIEVITSNAQFSSIVLTQY